MGSKPGVGPIVTFAMSNWDKSKEELLKTHPEVVLGAQSAVGKGAGREGDGYSTGEIGKGEGAGSAAKRRLSSGNNALKFEIDGQEIFTMSDENYFVVL